MDRAILTKALSRARDLPEDQFHSLSVEEIAVLQSFIENFPPLAHVSARQRALHCRLQRVIARWKSALPAPPPLLESPGQLRERTQLALRRALDKFQQSRFDEIDAEELRLVRAAFRALGECAVLERNTARLHELIATALRQYDARMGGEAETAQPHQSLPPDVLDTLATEWFGDAPPPEPPSPVIEPLTVDADALFAGKARRRVARLQGIDVNLLVACCELQGPIRLSGSVPEDMLLIVRDGSVVVDGYVLGHLVATGDITVTHNISGGWVITSEGDVTAAGILAKSKVIAKTGSVRCEAVELADTVFAWRDVVVPGRVVGGRLLGRNVRIDGRAASTEVHCVGRASFEAIETSQRGPAVVCLRRSISCEEYGRQMEPSARALHRRVRKLQAERDLALRVIRGLHEDIEHSFCTLLYYVHGSVMITLEAIEALRSIQAKQGYLVLLIDAAQRIEEFAAAALEGLRETDQTEAIHMPDACLSTLTDIQDRTRHLPPTPPKYSLNYRQAIVKACEQLREYAENLKRSRLTYYDLTRISGAIQRSIAEWDWIRQQLAKGVLDIAREYGLDPAMGLAADRRPGRLEQLWADAVARAQNEPTSDAGRRVGSSFVSVMLAGIEQNRRTIALWNQTLGVTQEKLDESSAQLEREAVALQSMPGHEPPRFDARWVGAGVVVTAKPGDLDGPPMPPAQTVRYAHDTVAPPALILEDSFIRSVAPNGAKGPEANS